MEASEATKPYVTYHDKERREVKDADDTPWLVLRNALHIWLGCSVDGPMGMNDQEHKEEVGNEL